MTRPSEQQSSYTEKGDEYVVKIKGKWKYIVAGDLGPGGVGRDFDRELVGKVTGDNVGSHGDLLLEFPYVWDHLIKPTT